MARVFIRNGLERSSSSSIKNIYIIYIVYFIYIFLIASAGKEVAVWFSAFFFGFVCVRVRLLSTGISPLLSPLLLYIIVFTVSPFHYLRGFNTKVRAKRRAAKAERVQLLQQQSAAAAAAACAAADTFRVYVHRRRLKNQQEDGHRHVIQQQQLQYRDTRRVYWPDCGVRTAEKIRFGWLYIYILYLYIYKYTRSEKRIGVLLLLCRETASMQIHTEKALAAGQYIIYIPIYIIPIYIFTQEAIEFTEVPI